MAIFQVNKKKKDTKNIKKIFGWIILFLSTIVFLFSVTKLVPFLQQFFLGILGVFVYPFCVLGLIISLALLNDKKYVMPKAYAIFLSLSLVLFLSIIQLIIIGLPKDLSYGQYIALNYTKKFTAGGMIIGFIPSSLLYLMGAPATYVVLSIGLIVSIAFFVENVLSFRKTIKEQKPISFLLREKKEKVNPFEKTQSPEVEKRRPILDDNINITFDASRKEEQSREMTAREKLGLVGNYKGNQPQQTLVLPKEEKAEGKVPKGMSIKEYLLSPPKVDMDEFLSRRPKPRQTQSQTSQINSNQYTSSQSYQTSVFSNGVSQNEINSNIQSLKNEQNNVQSTYETEENFDFSQEQIKRQNLSDIKPEEITNEAENIIKSVAMQEQLERGEIQNNQNNDEYFDFGNSINDDNDIVNNDSDINVDSFDTNDSVNYNVNDNTNQTDNILSRDNNLNSRDNILSRDSLHSNDRILSRDDNISSPRSEIFSRDERKENKIEQNENRFRPNDEIAKRKRFVNLEEDKPAKKIVPYKYNRPPIDLITTVSDDPSRFNDEIPMKRVALENALENFGVPAKVQNVVIGPTVTRYEIEMPEGISVKRILSLDADIAYALSANGQIRIEAPIPGRSIVGIEVPNNKVAKVSIKDVLQSKEFTLSPSPLTFALGKDISGNVRVCNLQKMPHLLVAGTTGSGKSVCLNCIITSILYKASPDEVKFILIDPKQVELSMYEGLPHLVVPRVITDPNKAVNALSWAVDEMERRFKLISEERVRNIGEYNKIDKVLSCQVEKMPYIIIIFDEFADFMAINKNEIEDKIRRLAGKARAAGIHLILATQRPSTDVVTGTLKANLPARIAFKVASRVDSEVIMGATGAEKLLGYGDMLYKPADSEPARLQGCFIDTPETKDIVNYITVNNEEIFDEEAFNAINNPNKSNNGGGNDKDGVDPLLPQALKICIDNGVASTTMVQRKLSIGYPRAARIVDQMEERGYISSAEGSKQRSVYITIEEFYSIFGDIYD